MAGERVKLEVAPREQRGSAESRRLRRAGLVPGILYGRSEPQAFSVAERELRRALSGPGGLNTILDVVLESDGGDAHPSILKEFQQDPLRGRVIHVDLQEVRLDRPIQSAVNVHLVGEAEGVKEGGVLSQVAMQVNVEALPMEIPEHIDIDVSGLAIGDAVRLADLTPPTGVTFIDDPDETLIASVTLPTRVEEPEEALEEGEEIEGEVPEGEAAPEGGAEAPLEPGADAGTGPGGEPGTVEG